MKEDELREFIGADGHFSTMFDFSAHELTRSEQGWYQNPPLVFLEWRKTVLHRRTKDAGGGVFSEYY